MRHAEWGKRLTAYLHGIRATPYDPVKHNCGCFALGVIESVRGQPPGETLATLGLDAMPDTEIGVKRLLVERGDMGRIAAAFFGREPSTDVLSAQRGDIAVLPGETGDSLGVVENGAVLVLTSGGLERHSIREAMGYWNV